jgi:pimeloyl-ACP methyl ester carboxylesterase
MITALHGFLGLPSDWAFLGPDVRAVDLWHEEIPPEGDVLLGYSMGGRLALQLLGARASRPPAAGRPARRNGADRGTRRAAAGGRDVRAPYRGAARNGDDRGTRRAAAGGRDVRAPYRRAVIVSAGIDKAPPGRAASDEQWARRFESEPWPQLMEAWNAQPLFGGHRVERREEDFDRAALVRALREWSPAVLPAPELERIDIPVLWIAGAQDAKYVEIATRAVQRLPNAELWIAGQAGHRVPWEQPEAFAARLREFADAQ